MKHIKVVEMRRERTALLVSMEAAEAMAEAEWRTWSELQATASLQ
jgi:hypothetical protein